MRSFDCFANKWDDMFGNVEEGQAAAALTREVYRDTPYLMRFFRHDQDDYLHLAIQMSHKWNRATAVRFHGHVVPMANAGGNVYWQYNYIFVPVSGTIPANVGWAAGNVTSPILAADQYRHTPIDLVTVPVPAGASASTTLLIRLGRLGSSPNDTYNTNGGGGTPQANLGVLYFDLHYQQYAAGTVFEFND